MSNNKEITNEESFAIIRQMIEAAKADQKDDGLGWIIWGWMLFSASVLTIINLEFKWFETFFFWNIFGLMAILLLIISTIKKLAFKNKKGAQTYVKDVFRKLNIGFTFSLLLIIVAMNVTVDPRSGFALITGLYGFWIMIYGALLNFKPSMIATYIVFALAALSLFVPTFQWVMIIHAVAVLLGYIIPGHIAYKEFNKLKNRQINKTSIGV